MFARPEHFVAYPSLLRVPKKYHNSSIMFIIGLIMTNYDSIMENRQSLQLWGITVDIMDIMDIMDIL